LLEVVIGALD